MSDYRNATNNKKSRRRKREKKVIEVKRERRMGRGCGTPCGLYPYCPCGGGA